MSETIVSRGGYWKRLSGLLGDRRPSAERFESANRGKGGASPFRAIVAKEFGDHMRSWRFVILLGIVALACIGSIYAAVTAIQAGVQSGQADDEYLFLQMFTASDGTLPTFVTFVSFLGPLIGIALGFDAVNSERNKGTLSRLLSQPVYRGDFILAKFAAALLLIAVVLFSLGFLVMGLGLVTIGYPPTPEEAMRVVLFLLVAVVFVGFWLNLSILFSICFRQAATSALSGIALWLFFSVFYSMITGLIDKATAPAESSAFSVLLRHYEQMLLLNRLSPSYLFSEATSTLLMPNVRTLGPLTTEQVVGAIASPLPLLQSVLLSWPQLVGLLAATMVCFGLSYALFMRQEIRSR
ncbi:ABC transporter permease [Paenibacillus arenilitoris]|uniref:ABC transporter permease n=1 Tax=Paenibacillus arenilitoris TaxID=2772299 RepID=A0A927H5J5_9BACL|nr:ABC transporter permease [Paenibacillus arenilitoris]MBD2867619.1 ABC transporter permease [Paenibacillus arenilitoris]